jgi:hypothetical protein
MILLFVVTTKPLLTIYLIYYYYIVAYFSSCLNYCFLLFIKIKINLLLCKENIAVLVKVVVF